MRRFSIISGIMFLCAPALAQDYLYQGFAASRAMNTMMAANLERQLEAGQEFGTQKSTAALAILVYRPSLVARKKNLAQFVEKTRAIDSAGAAQLQQMFAQGDMIEQIGKGLAPYGLRTDNVADAYAAWWVNAWQAWAGVTDNGTREQAQAVKQQAARALSATPVFASATDPQKQEMAEALLIQAAMIGAVAEQLKTNPAVKPQIKSAMTHAAKAMGLDFSKMKLTGAGFVPIDALVGSAKSSIVQQKRGTAPVQANRPAPPSTLPANIDSLRFFYFAGGPGGVDPRPVILFKNGVLCDCIEYAFGAADPLVFRGQHPADFGKWRRNAKGEFEVMWDDSRSWSGLTNTTAKPLPTNWRAKGYFSRTSSVGMMGAENATFTSSTSSLSFALDGRFSEGNSISSTGNSGGASVVAGGTAGPRGGRYEVRGYSLILSYNDGRKKQLTAVWESDPDVVWLNGRGYIR